MPVLLALAIRLVGRPPARAAFRWRTDGAVGLALSVVTAWFVCRFLGALRLTGPAFASSDFGQYCQDVAYAAGLATTESTVRSHFVAAVLGPLATLTGVPDALALGAAASMVGTMYGLYLWGHALGGRVGAFAALVFATGLDPLLILARHLTFYPEIVAVFTLAAGLTTLAAREDARWSLFLPAVIATSLTPLVDLRGFAWVAVLGLALAIQSLPSARPVPRLAVLALALVLSWKAGPIAMPGTGATIESTLRSVAVTTLSDTPGAAEYQLAQRWCPLDGPGFKWGSGDPIAALRCSQALMEMARTLGVARDVRPGAVELWVTVWMPLCAASTLVLVGAHRRRPWLLAVIAASIFPFTTGWGTFAWMESEIRRVFTLLPPIAALLGGAFGAIATGSASERPARWRDGVTVLALVVLVDLHTPLTYTWWSPAATWRLGLRAGGEHEFIGSLRGAGADECRRANAVLPRLPAGTATLKRWIFGSLPPGPTR